MIYLDSSEKRSGKTPKMGAYLPWLEEITGADAIVTPSKLPLNEGTLMFHTGEGACLLQIKHEGDLAASVGNRLNSAIARMIPLTRYAWQRQLVPVGMYHGADNQARSVEVAVDTGRKPYWRSVNPAVPFDALQTAAWHWTLRGGCFIPFVQHPMQLQSYCMRLDHDLIELSKKKKKVYPELPAIYSDPRQDDPLQKVELIKDGRRILTAFPGIGQQRADDLWEKVDGQLWHALLILSEPWQHKKSPKKFPGGIGKKTVENARDILGLTGDYADFQLALELVARLKEDKK